VAHCVIGAYPLSCDVAIQRTSLNVSLTPELERFISACVVSGRYQPASEVVRAALRVLEQSDSREDRRSIRVARDVAGTKHR
jgi:antitoxin ParD1/3/4